MAHHESHVSLTYGYEPTLCLRAWPSTRYLTWWMYLCLLQGGLRFRVSLRLGRLQARATFVVCRPFISAVLSAAAAVQPTRQATGLGVFRDRRVQECLWRGDGGKGKARQSSWIEATGGPDGGGLPCLVRGHIDEAKGESSELSRQLSKQGSRCRLLQERRRTLSSRCFRNR